MRYTLLLVLLMCVVPDALRAQVLLYHDIFNGGVCADGFATDNENYGNPAKLRLDIPPGAQIRKAFLLAGEHFSQGDPQVVLDGKAYRINLTTRITGPFATVYGQSAYLHLLDITEDFDPLLTVHTLEAPLQSYPTNRFNEFYIVVCYELPSMDKVEISIFGNDQDFQERINYSIPQHDVSLATPYALAVMGGYICRRASDGEQIFVNGHHIGTLDTNDKNSGICGGPVGSFRFEDKQLFGVGDDTPDDRMGRNDALANIASYLSEDALTMDLEFVHTPSQGLGDNSIWAVVTVSGSGCRRQFASGDTLICRGQQLQLSPKHDTLTYLYRWAELNSDDQLSGQAPIVTPSISTTYLATITDGEGCLIYDTMFVDVTAPTSISVALTDERSLFDDVSGEVKIVVRSVPPLSVRSEQRISATLAIDKDLIELNSIATDKEGKVSASLTDWVDGYQIELEIPSEYGILDSIHVTLSGKSFLAIAPSDSLHIVDIAHEGDLFCIDLQPSPIATLIARQPECGDYPTREAWMKELNEVKLEVHGRSLIINSQLSGEYRIGIYDILGRELLQNHVEELPVSIELPITSSAPIIIRIYGKYGAHSRMILP